MAGQPPHTLGEIERTALAHPMAEEIEAEPGIAQIDQVSAGIGQRNDPGLVLDQRLDALIDGVEEAADKPGVEVFLKAEIEHRVERVAVAFANDVGDRAVGEPAFSGLTGAATMIRSQLPWNTVPGFGLRRSARKASRKLASRKTAFSCSRS